MPVKQDCAFDSCGCNGTRLAADTCSRFDTDEHESIRLITSQLSYQCRLTTRLDGMEDANPWIAVCVCQFAHIEAQGPCRCTCVRY